MLEAAFVNSYKIKNHPTVLVLLILLGLASIFYLSIVYQDTLGERDSFRMVMGIIDSITTNKPLGSSMLYGRDVSFAYFLLIDFFRSIFKLNLTQIIPLMNYINALSAIFMVIPFFLLVKRYWGITVALLANVLLMSLPVWRVTSQYAHPMTGAIVFMFIGLALIGYRTFIGSLRVRWSRLILLDVLIIAAFALCVMFRLDAILMFPLIPACLLLEKYSLDKIIVSSAFYIVSPVVIFKVLQSQLPEIVDQKSDSLFDQLLFWNNPTRYLDNFIHGNLIFVWSLSVLLFIIFFLSCIYLVHERNHLSLFFILPTTLLNYIFWLPNPSPARHFIYLSPVVAIGIAIFLVDFSPKLKKIANNRNRGVILAIVLIISLSLSYKFSYSAPMSEKYSYAVRDLGNKLQQLEPKNKPIFVVGDTIPAVVQMQLISKDIKVKFERTNILTNEDIEAQEKYIIKPKPININLITVQNENNKFIFYLQGWKSKITEAKRFLAQTPADNQGYLVLNILDRDARKIEIEASTLTNKFEILKL